MESLEVTGGSVAAIIAVVEILGRIAKVPKRYLPIISVLLGTGLGLAQNLSLAGAIQGILMGAGASGLSDQRKIIGKTTQS